MIKKKKISIRELKQQIKRQELSLINSHQHIKDLTNEKVGLQQQIRDKDRYNFKSERAELIKALAQLTESLSKAITHTVAKEQL